MVCDSIIFIFKVIFLIICYVVIGKDFSESWLNKLLNPIINCNKSSNFSVPRKQFRTNKPIAMQLFCRLLLSLCIAMIFFGTVLSQSSDSIRPDYNPKLTKAESEWLNQHIDRDGFDFNEKYVAFVQLLTGGFYGIGKFTLPLHQKHIFIPEISKSFYKLYVLTEEEKKQTNGLDAIFVLGNKKHQGKMRRIKREKLVAEYTNSYPQIPDDAGKDNDPVLSPANAVFFNEIYRYSKGYLPEPFDFSGKKLAIFSADDDLAKVERKSIAGYVQKTQAALDVYGHAIPDFTYILTAEEKKESGGYDVIIKYRSKMGVPLKGLIAKLKKDDH
jgi:hypothetical protein